MDTHIRRHVQLIRTSCEIGIQASRAGAFAERSFPECGKLRNTPRALTCHTRPYRKRQNAHHPCYVALTSLFPSIKRPKKEADTGAATSSDDSPTTDEDATTSDKDANTPDDVASTITRRPPYVPARNCSHITAALNDIARNVLPAFNYIFGRLSCATLQYRPSFQVRETLPKALRSNSGDFTTVCPLKDFFQHYFSSRFL